MAYNCHWMSAEPGSKAPASVCADARTIFCWPSRRLCSARVWCRRSPRPHVGFQPVGCILAAPGTKWRRVAEKRASRVDARRRSAGPDRCGRFSKRRVCRFGVQTHSIVGRGAYTRQVLAMLSIRSRGKDPSLIKRWTTTDEETGRADSLFFQYDERGGANLGGPN